MVTGPLFQQYRPPLLEADDRQRPAPNFEFAVEMLNAFNKANFVPVRGIGNNIADYEVTALTGTNTARLIQIVGRYNW